MGGGGLWREGERSLVVCHSVIKPALRPKAIGQIEMRFGKIRHDRKGTLVSGARLVEFSYIVEDHAEIVMCLGKVRHDGQSGS